MARLVALLLVAPLAFGAPGCGSGSSGREEWAAEATALCLDLGRALRSLERPQDAAAPDEASSFVAETAGEVEAWLGEMRKLEPPSGDEGRVGRMLALYGEAVSAAETAADTLEAGDTGGFSRLLAQADVSSTEAGRMARELGADGCEFRLAG